MSKYLIKYSKNKNPGFNFNCNGLLLVHSRVMTQTNVDLDLSYVMSRLRFVGSMGHRTISNNFYDCEYGLCCSMSAGHMPATSVVSDSPCLFSSFLFPCLNDFDGMRVVTN